MKGDDKLMNRFAWKCIIAFLLIFTLAIPPTLANEGVQYEIGLPTGHNTPILPAEQQSEKSSKTSYTIAHTSSHAQSWGKKQIGSERLIKKTKDLEGIVIVAVIDTGIDASHPFLRERLVAGYNVLDNDFDTNDEHFHGTHISGVIVDNTPANVKIMPIRALDKEGKGYDNTIAEAIRYAVDNGADIINMSFVSEEYSSYLSEAIDYALMHDVVIVAAAGNENMDTANLYPAGEQKVIVVGATDKNNRIADFSNTGASIDLAAPGVDISSSVPGGGFKSYSGTSIATPFVSAAAAMLKLEDPDRTVVDIERLVKKYVVDMGPVGWDSQYGEGILNLSKYDEVTLIDNTSQKLLTETRKILETFPEQRNVPLHKSWSITFDRELTEYDKVDIRVFRSGKDVPIRIVTDSKEIKVTPIRKLHPGTDYKLYLLVENGGQYEMDFSTAK